MRKAKPLQFIGLLAALVMTVASTQPNGARAQDPEPRLRAEIRSERAIWLE